MLIAMKTAGEGEGICVRTCMHAHVHLENKHLWATGEKRLGAAAVVHGNH